MPNFDFLADRLHSLTDAGRLRSLNPRTHEGMHLLSCDGSRLLNFGSNDYLGLAAQQTGSPASDSRCSPLPASGSGASALVSGWTHRHQLLADQIAHFEGTESAVLFPTGYAACCGTVATLASAGDLILSDSLNHASLIDGCRLSKAQRVIYPHGDGEAVGEILAQRRSEFDHVWIVTDGVFGMDGHVAPLNQLTDLANKYDAFVVVDEAHGTGVLGQSGQGACQELGVKSQVAVTIGTLSKAIGAQGGFVAGAQPLIDYLINRCRTLIYSTSLAPYQVEAALDGLRSVIDHPERRKRVQELSCRFRDKLSIEAPEPESRVPIIPVVLGDDQKTVRASARLAELGFYVPAIRPPTVPEGTGRLRVSLSAEHDRAMVDLLAAAIASL
jgi:8-amino-7-oxononanoate synthase